MGINWANYDRKIRGFARTLVRRVLRKGAESGQLLVNESSQLGFAHGTDLGGG
jgi:hypothetical protein